MSPVEFWELTPYLTKKAVPALSDGRNTLAWTTAALHRAKKIPRLHEMMAVKEERSKGEMESELKKALGLGRKNG
jgi:hypothetical protein